MSIRSLDFMGTPDAFEKLKTEYASNYNQLGLDAYIQSIKGSQTGEDGVQLKIFQDIGTIQKRGHCVDFGAGDGTYASSTKMLREDLGFSALLMDGDATSTGNPSFKSLEDNTIKREFITKDNIVGILQKYNTPTVFDFLSVDIDGNEFYVTKEILKKYSPSVVQCETNPFIRPSLALTIPYNEDWVLPQPITMYYGVSLLAMTKLMNYYRYSLVCTCEFNAIYLRNDLLAKLSVSIPDINNCEKMYKGGVITSAWLDSANGEWVEVTDQLIKN